MAIIEPPVKSAKRVKEHNPPIMATDKASPIETKPLQLQVPSNIKNEYKAFCANKGRSMSDIFLEMYGEYKDKYGTM